jgi:hypothetical protein
MVEKVNSITMSILNKLATFQGKRSDVPNQELADEIIATKNNDAVKELVLNLKNKNKNIQSDCIKVLYEIGERGAADLIAPYYKEFGEILSGKNNRLIWGAMTALDTITLVYPMNISGLLDKIIKAIDSGSVITIDHGVSILAKLSTFKENENISIPLLIAQLKKCPAKQFPMYIEKSAIAINAANKRTFIDVIELRWPELEKDSQKKRVEKVLKKYR